MIAIRPRRRVQQVPQVIIGGQDLATMSPDEIGRMSRQAEIRNDIATLGMIERFLAAQMREFDRTGVFDENGRELTPQEAFDEAVAELGLGFDENGILVGDAPTGFFCGGDD